MGKRAGRKKTRAVKQQSAKGTPVESPGKPGVSPDGENSTGQVRRKSKYSLPADPAEGIRVTYEMMGPDTKAVVDRLFRDKSRAEYIANL